MPSSTLNPQPSRERIEALHSWYSRNVMALRLTPEVERLWWDWLKAGYNGTDLRDVVRYIRRQISLGKRNEGALKLSNLFARSEGGFLKFDEDLGLARARANLSTDKRLEPAPDAQSKMEDGRSKMANTQHATRNTPATTLDGERAFQEFRKAKERL